jgi:carboxyl-terminal processing protease
MPKPILLTIIFFLFSYYPVIYCQVDEEQLYKFKQVIENINNYYVDSIDESMIIDKAIIAALKELDPHSVYYTKDEADEINKGLSGSFMGIGITYDILNDTVMIISVVKDCPAQAIGIKPGDRIIEINSIQIAGIGITDKKMKALFKGEKGTELILGIMRKGTSTIEQIRIKIDEIPVKSISASYLYKNEIAYIKLNRFGAKTTDEFRDATEGFIKNGITKFVLDLRNNSGGYLYTSVNLLENFLEKNTVVLYTKGDKSPDKEYSTQNTGKLLNADLVVLIDETTASAGEIFSGAIQDWDRGVIIGRRSFGKGLVQKPIYLVDGSMIRLTTARYYTPSGRNIQKPYSTDFEAYENDLELRMKTGELMHKDSIKLTDSIKYYTLSNHRLIHGGGGIMPDIFIPIDTLKLPGYYNKKVIDGSVTEFVHFFVDHHRDFFDTEYSNFDTYYEDYIFTKENTYELIDKIFKDVKNINDIKKELINNEAFYNHIKALIADDLYDENAFYKVYNNTDAAFIKAIEILKNKTIYHEILINDVVGDYEYKEK